MVNQELSQLASQLHCEITDCFPSDARLIILSALTKAYSMALKQSSEVVRHAGDHDSKTVLMERILAQ